MRPKFWIGSLKSCIPKPNRHVNDDKKRQVWASICCWTCPLDGPLFIYMSMCTMCRWGSNEIQVPRSIAHTGVCTPRKLLSQTRPDGINKWLVGGWCRTESKQEDTRGTRLSAQQVAPAGTTGVALAFVECPWNFHENFHVDSAEINELMRQLRGELYGENRLNYWRMMEQR